MKALEFIKLWKEFINKDLSDPDAVRDFLDDKLWTKRVLGEASRLQEGSPLGDCLRASLGEEKFEYRTEEYKIDLVVSKKENLNNIELKGFHSGAKDYPSSYYPSNYEILIEHENNITDCWREMFKLAFFKASLKVLITYDWNDEFSGEKPDQEKIASTFGRIVATSNEKLAENASTEYLMILGQRRTSKERFEINWKYWVFDSYGDLTLYD